MNQKFSRGGAKPKMLPAGSTQLAITVRDERKYGMYELSGSGDILARRVELPHWLSKLWSVHSAIGGLRIPHDAKVESRGHIYLRPPRDQFKGPAVGMDMEIYRLARELVSLNVIRFYVYGIDYTLVDIWNISRDAFINKASYVPEAGSFMPQMMVEIAAMSSAMIREPKQQANQPAL